MTVNFTILYMIDGAGVTLFGSVPLCHIECIFCQQQDRLIFSSHEHYHKTCSLECIRCWGCQNLSLLTSTEESAFYLRSVYARSYLQSESREFSFS